MDIRVLEYFLQVAKEGSITRAAEALHMTQPPLSRQLKDLEDELGKQLFVRGSKKITLTEEGVLLRKRAEEIVELLSKTRSEICARDGGISGDIYIGSGETDAFSAVAETAKRLQKTYPKIRYKIYSGDAERIMERLDKGLLDLGLLVSGEPFDPKKYDHISLPAKDRWGVLMRADCDLARKKSVKPEDLWDMPLLISHQSAGENEVFDWLGKGINELNIVAFYDLLYNASRFVKSGLGYAITLDKLTNFGSGNELCFRPLKPKLETGLCIVWKHGQVFSKATEVFLREMREGV